MFANCSCSVRVRFGSTCSWTVRVRFGSLPNSSSDIKICSIKLSNIVRFVKILSEFGKSSSEFVRVRFVYSSRRDVEAFIYPTYIHKRCRGLLVANECQQLQMLQNLSFININSNAKFLTLSLACYWYLVETFVCSLHIFLIWFAFYYFFCATACLSYILPFQLVSVFCCDI